MRRDMEHTVVVHAAHGNKYEFSGVTEQDASRLRSPFFYDNLTSLILSNMEGACLTLPAKFVERVLVDGETAWKSPTCPV